jgi:hypothetical protein
VLVASKAEKTSFEWHGPNLHVGLGRRHAADGTDHLLPATRLVLDADLAISDVTNAAGAQPGLMQSHAIRRTLLTSPIVGI